MAECLIMRGLPGSGKSHLIKNMISTLEPEQVLICSADHYFMVDNQYVFDSSKLSIAHNYCLRLATDNIISHSKSLIIIDNTNLSPTEYSPYYRIAEIYGYNPRIITVDCNPLTCILRNQHGVPPLSILQMWRRMIEGTSLIPHWWNKETINNG